MIAPDFCTVLPQQWRPFVEAFGGAMLTGKRRTPTLIIAVAPDRRAELEAFAVVAGLPLDAIYRLPRADRSYKLGICLRGQQVVRSFSPKGELHDQAKKLQDWPLMAYIFYIRSSTYVLS